MVQRKLPTKLTLQLDHAKAQSDLKSPRGADLKAKKMKKSRSLKRQKHPSKPTPPPPPAAQPLCKTPNYMKSTTSSDARKEQSQPKPRLKASPSSSSSSSSSSGGKKAAKTAARALTKNPSFKPARKCSPVVVCESSVDAKRATCSSTLKDCKFPDFLSLNPEGTSAVKVCPYTYCSLNGHHHRPLPPLKSFLSARRRAIKTQRSVKIGCLSPRRAPAAVVGDDFKSSSSVNPLTQEAEDNDFFVEIYSAGIDETVAQYEEERVCDDFGQNQEEINEEDSDMEWETAGYGSPLQIDYDYDYECSPQTHVETNPEADEVDIKVSSDKKDCYCVDEFLMDEASQESFDEEGLSSDAFSSSDDDNDNGDGDDDQHSFSTSTPLQEEESQDYEVSSSDDQNHENEEAVAVAEIGEEAAEAECGISSKAVAELETEDIALLHFTANAKKLQVEEDGDDLGAFNPRGPNFLPLEPDPEAEKVDLRHQDLDERKNSEEWMVDFALRQVVTKLGPARKRKVALLVEAFEKVMPTTKFDLHLGHGSSFDQPRPMQACS